MGQALLPGCFTCIDFYSSMCVQSFTASGDNYI